jgi:hypothetical protein
MTAITAAPAVVTERARRVTEAVHSAEMEGLKVSAATFAIAQEYVRGAIDSDELVARVRARHRLA